MPQCYNPSLVADQDTSAFGKNSRYMKANNFNLHTLRRVNVLNSLEAKFTRMRLSVMERNTQNQLKMRSQARVNILESYKRTLAYRLVVKKHPIRKNPDFNAALNDNYSFHSLRHEIKAMLNDIDPNIVRHRKARERVHECKDTYQGVIAQNLAKIVDIVPKKRVVPEVVTEVESRTPTPPPPPRTFRRSIIGPPLRGLAKEAQGVTLKMVKEKSWMGVASPSGQTAGSPSKTPGLINPRPALPPIQGAPHEIEAAA
ncbi:uncharacterized protein LOC106011837 [Aplysia californica]|uniref:Uncharacterized protein LOC106011837 n=1 Tax=Aplysia californica TaxID=6500 RepID=A0ABM1A0G9_APLCA|nr:uncharacterized protein LOC106011837 [Aplysia californica]